MSQYEVFIVGKRDEAILFCTDDKEEAIDFARRFRDPSDGYIEIREYDFSYNTVSF